MDFFLFLLVNATLFLRPSEIFSNLQTVPIYNILIITDLLIASPKIIRLFGQRNFSHAPAAYCVLGVFSCIVLSHLSKGDFYSARYTGFEFAKVVAYYLLLVSQVDSPRRFFLFLSTIAGLTLLSTAAAELQYHKVIELPALSAMAEDVDSMTGEKVTIFRLRSTGIFHDPNDFSMIIVISMVIFAQSFFIPSFGVPRLISVIALGTLAYGLMLTHSRGGLLAMLAAGFSICCSWYGWKRGVLLGGLLIPVALIFFGGGRQTDLSSALSSGTAKGRFEIWSDWLQAFKSQPVFGVGAGLGTDINGYVAHNSYVHALVETGIFGGILFVGCIYVSFLTVAKLNSWRLDSPSNALAQIQPCVLALIVAPAVSMLSLSRNYVVSPYLTIGLASSYHLLAFQADADNCTVWNGRLQKQIALAGVIVFTCLYCLMRLAS